MEMMLIKEKETGREVATRTPAGNSVAVAKGTLLGLSPSIPCSQAQSPHPSIYIPNATANIPVGQIVFKELHSAYFDADFWAGVVGEVGLLQVYLLREQHGSLTKIIHRLKI
jgi:hypothetical protein